MNMKEKALLTLLAFAWATPSISGAQSIDVGDCSVEIHISCPPRTTPPPPPPLTENQLFFRQEVRRAEGYQIFLTEPLGDAAAVTYEMDVEIPLPGEEAFPSREDGRTPHYMLVYLTTAKSGGTDWKETLFYAQIAKKRGGTQDLKLMTHAGYAAEKKVSAVINPSLQPGQVVHFRAEYRPGGEAIAQLSNADGRLLAEAKITAKGVLAPDRGLAFQTDHKGTEKGPETRTPGWVLRNVTVGKIPIVSAGARP